MGTMTVEKKAIVRRKFNFTCQHCGVRITDEERFKPREDEKMWIMEVDHIIPRKAGGTNDYSNLQCLCNLCNIAKHNLDNFKLRIKKGGKMKGYYPLSVALDEQEKTELEQLREKYLVGNKEIFLAGMKTIKEQKEKEANI